jgi:hypothetical protein
MDGRFDFFIGLVFGLLMGGLAIYASSYRRDVEEGRESGPGHAEREGRK